MESPDLPDGWIYAGMTGRGEAVFMAVPEQLVRSQINRLVTVLLAVAPVSLGLVALCAWFFSSRAVAPIRKLTQVASATTAEDLSRRIDGKGLEREFGELVEVFNRMLSRLEMSFEQARRFGQDAAHELNTPLTILTGRIDDAMARAELGSAEQKEWVGIADEMSRLREIVQKLHLLARIDGGGLEVATVDVDLNQLLSKILEEMREAFPAVDFSLKGEVCEVGRSDPTLIRQILLNLLGNAGRYNREGGSVVVEARHRTGRVEVVVTNTGPSIPEELRERIFDRFTRGDRARGREEGASGLGLGLSLSREFARAMGGDLQLASGEEDRVQFVLVLPVA